MIKNNPSNNLTDAKQDISNIINLLKAIPKTGERLWMYKDAKLLSYTNETNYKVTIQMQAMQSFFFFKSQVKW